MRPFYPLLGWATLAACLAGWAALAWGQPSLNGLQPASHNVVVPDPAPPASAPSTSLKAVPPSFNPATIKHTPGAPMQLPAPTASGKGTPPPIPPVLSTSPDS